MNIITTIYVYVATIIGNWIYNIQVLSYCMVEFSHATYNAQNPLAQHVGVALDLLAVHVVHSELWL